MNQPLNYLLQVRSSRVHEVPSDVSTQGDESEKIYPDHLQENPEHNHKNTIKDRDCKTKSSLCRNFIERGNCPYGLRCQFAHGTSQLRVNYVNNFSYKTKPCYNFIKQGFCIYGERCNFIHFFQRKLTIEENQLLWKEIYSHFRNVFSQQAESWSKQSKLIRLLGKSEEM